MYKITRGISQDLPDVAAFIQTINTAKNAQDLFDREHEIVVARAPGRLDVMGALPITQVLWFFKCPFKKPL